jgi:hypothetical protein
VDSLFGSFKVASSEPVTTLKLALVTPWSSPFIWKKFALNLAKMLTNFKRDKWELEFFMGNGVDPAARHIDMILQGLDWGADLICIIGADQIHPVDMLDRLIDRWLETQGGVISALVPFRGYVSWQNMRPFQPMGWRIVNPEPGVREFRNYTEDEDMFEPIDPEAGDLQRVDVIGSGVLLFHRDDILALEPPWFYYKVDPVTMARVADMDTKFVWRLRSEAQSQVWVDTTIKVSHIHDFEIDESFQHRFDDWITPGAGDADIFKTQERETAFKGAK